MRFPFHLFVVCSMVISIVAQGDLSYSLLSQVNGNWMKSQAPRIILLILAFNAIIGYYSTDSI